MNDDASTKAAVQENVQTAHIHVCDVCAREIHATHEYIRELYQFMNDFDLGDILKNTTMPSGPMGMILKSLIK